MSDPETPGLIDRKAGESWPDLYDRQQDQLIEDLALQPWQRKILHYRWLGAVTRIEGAANAYRIRHNSLRFFAIVGGVIVSGLVAGGASTANNPALTIASFSSQSLSVFAFVVSLAVTAAIALDEYFRYGDRYRESRLVAERLRIEGSRFTALTDDYAKLGSHEAAFAPFMKRVEDILEKDVEAWVGFAAPNSPPSQSHDGLGGAVVPPSSAQPKQADQPQSRPEPSAAPEVPK